METIPLEMDDIFGADNEEEEDNYPRPLPDLPEELEPTQNTDLNQDAENDAVLSKLKDMKGAAKKTIRRPIPKLDAKRLTGNRGIPILPKLFEDIKFKGKGHEMQDLKLIMDKFEHWGHRLFPKLPFDEVLERIEKLGSKKEVQTCIKKMRQDMPILDEDFVGDKNEEETEEINGNNNDISNNKQDDDLDAEEAFDEMMRKETSQRPPSTFDKLNSPPKSQSNELSEEQKEKIERNKRLAMEKRLARLGQKPTGSPSSKPSATSVKVDSNSFQPSTSNISAPEVSNSSQSSTSNISQPSTSNSSVPKASNISQPSTSNSSAPSTSNSSQPSTSNSSQPSTSNSSAPEVSNNISTSDKTSESTSNDIVVKQSVNIDNSGPNSDGQSTSSDCIDNRKEEKEADMDTEIVQSSVIIQSNEEDSIKPDDMEEENEPNISNEKTDKDKVTKSKDKGISQTNNDVEIINDMNCERKDNDNIAMETDEQQTAEEILNDLDDL